MANDAKRGWRRGARAAQGAAASGVARADAGALARALAVGGVGGAVAYALHVPLAFMLGAMFATMAASLLGAKVAVPDRVRSIFLALVGLFLGQSFGPPPSDAATGGALAQWTASLALSVAYVPVATALCYWFYLKVAGLDRLTALFAAIPGGLTAVVVFSSALGGDERKVALSQALRIAMVVVAAPALFFGVLGYVSPPLEDSQGPSMGVGDLALLGIGSGLVMLALRRLGAPMTAMIAPILASAVLRMGGWVEGELPVWLVEAALVVTGAAIGSRFAGADVRGLAALAGWTALGVALLTLVSATFASVVSSFMDVSWIAALLAFAPGGVAEMCLIAIALDADPGFVAAHHLARIGFILLATPFFAAWVARWTPKRSA